MPDDADLVGYIVGERPDGYYLYGCEEHAPADKREPHRQILRDEAAAEGATCDECGRDLADADAIP